jgi:hypothetical protein
MTGINANKIIQNLEFVNSFAVRKREAKKIFPSHFIFLFSNRVRCRPPRGRWGRGRVGVLRLIAASMGPGFQEWDPQISNWDPQLMQQSIGPEAFCFPQLNVSPAIWAIIPSHLGGRHIPDTAYSACGADVRILQ